MKYSPAIAIIGAACLFSSCEKEWKTVVVPEQAVDQSRTVSQWTEEDFTPWMSRAELQYLQNTGPSDQYFAHVEGRNNSGRLEYRAVIMPFTGEQYEQWAVFWGIDEEELFKCEMNLLGSGFVRQDMQVFADQTGRSVHQIVWLKPKTPVEGQEPDLTAGVTPQSSPAEPPPAVITPVAPIPHEAPVSEEVVEDAPVAQRVAESPFTTDTGSDGSKVPMPDVSKNSTYIVRQGDTLGKIAKSRKVTVAELKALNHLKSDILRIGQRLTVSGSRVGAGD